MPLTTGATEEARQHGRTNTMLAATLEFGGAQQPVFVRNLSASGALIEGKHLPLTGDTVVLQRSEQKISATVVWTSNNRCGLSFGAHVRVDAMIRRGKPSDAAPSHQARVDAIQRALRDQKPVPTFSESPSEMGAAAVGKRLVDELGYAHRLVETVNEALSNDAYVLSRYGVILQQIDEAEQLLRKLTNNLSAESASGRC